MATPFKNVPPELIISIMGYLTDFKSLGNLLRSSKTFNIIFRQNESTIAKDIMEKTIGPACSKLAVMTEVSEHINVADRNAVKQFIDTYTRDEEWPLYFYTIRLAGAAQNLNRIIRDFTNNTIKTCPNFEPEGLGSKCLSPTELRRLRRIFYICHIAGNLFCWNHRPRGRTSYFQPPFPELSRAFWAKVPA
ncbi:hypothetical protein GGR58DRAFT_208335 [Xylaria digitata]|nr:hypothetical protein GGR58DRAFT_208335 [Xylaria digitata]